MGYTSYSTTNRNLRATSRGYYTKSTDEIFEQNRKGEIHESMAPQKAKLRESRDSEVHPNTVPIILALDVTGSMGRIPHHLVKEGLPKIMGKIIQNGIPDPALLFLAIGDHEYDNYPLQVGQFESGDEELDTWLTRTYVEGGGGGNAGESYLLAWYYAAQHTQTDAFSKRGKKGFLFTIGDEPSLKSIPKNVINEQMGVTPQSAYTDKELLALAQETYNVFHLHVLEGYSGERSLGYWKDMLGQNCIEITNYEDIPVKLAEIVMQNTEVDNSKPIVLETGQQKTDETKKNDSEEEIIL